MKLTYFLAITIGLVIAAGFVATQPITAELSTVSVVSILAFALPSFYVVIRWRGWRQGLLILGGLGGYALLIETFAIVTNVPYGSFSYGDLLDYRLFGYTPWTVAFAWTPIMLFALSMTRSLQSWLGYGVATVAVLVVVDLVLDPAAVGLGFWAWDEPGIYYGVPVVNYLGWVASGTVGFALFQALNRSGERIPLTASSSGVGMLIFWTAVNIGLMQWIPAFIGMVATTVSVGYLWRQQLLRRV